MARHNSHSPQCTDESYRWLLDTLTQCSHSGKLCDICAPDRRRACQKIYDKAAATDNKRARVKLRRQLIIVIAGGSYGTLPARR